jgi:hypothetical protein
MIGGRSIIKPKERVPYFDAHIIGKGVNDLEEYQNVIANMEDETVKDELINYLLHLPENSLYVPEEPTSEEEVDTHESKYHAHLESIKKPTQAKIDAKQKEHSKILKSASDDINVIYEYISNYEKLDTSQKTQLTKKIKKILNESPNLNSNLLMFKDMKESININLNEKNITKRIEGLTLIHNHYNNIMADYVPKIESEIKNIQDEFVSKYTDIQNIDLLKERLRNYKKQLRKNPNSSNRDVVLKKIEEYEGKLEKENKRLKAERETIIKDKIKEKEREVAIKKIGITKELNKYLVPKEELKGKTLKELNELLKTKQNEKRNEERQKSDKILIDKFKSLYTHQEQPDIFEEIKRQLDEDKILSESLLGTLNYMISEKYAEQAEALKSKAEPIRQDYVDAKLKAYNLVTKGPSITEEIKNAYEQGAINNSTYTAIINGMKLKYPELNANYEAKKAGKTLTQSEMKKILKSYDTTHGKAFETLMTGTEGIKYMSKLTGSKSSIIPTDQSKNIDHIIVGSDSSGFPITLAESCVIDAYNDEACFEFKARISSKGAIDYSKVDYIGLTDTKLSNNASFRLVFDKTSDGKFKIKNVNITDPRNKSKKLFTDNVSKDYYAIFLFSDLKVYYYDILDDMTDDVNDYGDNGRKKGILVKKLLSGYQFVSCKYELTTTSIGSEYQIPKDKIHKII